MFFSFNSSIVLAKLVTLQTGTYSIAPADVFETTGVRPTALLFGIMIPWAPTASAVLIIEPKLCGSLISSNIIKNGGPSIPANISSNST